MARTSARDGTNAAHLTVMTKGSESSPRRLGRPNKAEPFRELVEEALANAPDLSTLELLERATQAGYQGGKSAFYDLVAHAREQKLSSSRLEALPGERSRHHVFELSHGGGRRRASVLVTRLEYSRWIAASVVSRTGVESVARALVEHFALAGGVPLLATLDSPRFSPDELGHDVEMLAHLALDLGVGLELFAPSRGRFASGRRMKIVNVAKEGLFDPSAPIADEADLAARVVRWVEDENTHADEQGTSPELALIEERRRLRPLKVTLAELSLRTPIVVQPGSLVVHEGRTYKLPNVAAGSTGMLFLTLDQVRIVVGSVVAIFHRRGSLPPLAHA